MIKVAFSIIAEGEPIKSWGKLQCVGSMIRIRGIALVIIDMVRSGKLMKDC